jgi:hypothetical protein
MSNLEYPSAVEPAPEAAGLSQWQRVTNTFTAPSKTFEDIKRGHKSWWLPFVIIALVSLHFLRGHRAQDRYAAGGDNQIRLDPKAEESWRRSSGA